MSLKGVPEPVERFVLTNVHSVEQLEVLLHLRAHADREWTVQAINNVLKTSPTSVTSRLFDLMGRKLVGRRREAGGPDVYRYAPAPELMETINGLARVYHTHSVRIIELIYSRPAEAIRLFAEAFRVRKEGGD